MANMAYYALLKLGIRPSEWLDMDDQEKFFIIACIEVKAKADKKKEKEAKKRRKR